VAHAREIIGVGFLKILVHGNQPVEFAENAAKLATTTLGISPLPKKDYPDIVVNMCVMHTSLNNVFTLLNSVRISFSTFCNSLPLSLLTLFTRSSHSLSSLALFPLSSHLNDIVTSFTLFNRVPHSLPLSSPPKRHRQSLPSTGCLRATRGSLSTTRTLPTTRLWWRCTSRSVGLTTSTLC